MQCGKNMAFGYIGGSGVGLGGKSDAWEFLGGTRSSKIEFGAGYYNNPDMNSYVSMPHLWNKTDFHFAKILDHTRQDAINFFDVKGCKGQSGTLHFDK